MDSAAVLSLMTTQTSRPVKTFTIGFGDPAYDELDDARATAAHFGAEHHQQLVTPDCIRVAEALAVHYDEPFADASAIPTFHVAELARRHVTVCLTGDGGDELFAGYDRYRDYFRKRVLYRIPNVLRRPVAGVLSSVMPWGARGKRFLRSLTLDPFDDYVWGDGELWHGDLLQPSMLASLSDADPMEPARRLFSANAPSELDALCLHDINLYLPDDILTKVDRMSMAVSLEVRVPLLDHRVAEFAGTLPPSMRLRGRTGKYLLKKLLERYLPPEMVHRPKQGFGVPLGRWFRQELREELLDTLTPDRVRCVGVFRPSAVEFLVRQHLSRQRDQSTLLWRLFVFHLWDRLRLPRSNPATGHAAAPVAAAAS
jgi:asparagine synthase (glutamine-hydrolysing)